MLDERVLAAMASVESRIKPTYKTKLREIVSLCEEYRYLGGSFTFKCDPILERAVNKALVELSDSILAIIRKRLLELLEELGEEEHYEEVVSLSEKDSRVRGTVERIDLYCSDLKARLLGFLALGFAMGLPKDRIIAEIEAYGDPMMSPLWKRASDEEKIDRGTLIPLVSRNVGRGRLRGFLKGVAAIGSFLVASGYHNLNIGVLYPMMGAVGYKVHRGSTYDCPQCDELCVGIHPLSEVVLPSHPRCCCYTTMVYMDSDGRYVER